MDAIWELEYEESEILKEEIEKICKTKGMECPKFQQYARSRELKEILKKLKEKN